jgi:hypothetical protein
LLARVECIRAGTGESRSAVIGRALAKLTAEEISVAKTQRYVEAYRKTPERAREVAAARRLARRTVAGLPWDVS